MFNLINYHIYFLSVQSIRTNFETKQKFLIKKSINSTFVILIIEISKHRPFYIWSFQILNPTLIILTINTRITFSSNTLAG